MNMDGMTMVEAQERVLTVTNYVEHKGGHIKKRVTIAPHAISFIVASEEAYDDVGDVELRQVNVVLGDGNNLELYISMLDLITLERVTGNYFLP